MEKAIIQLYGESGQEIALFSFDTSQHKEEDAANIIENAVEAAYQKDEAGELEGGDVLSEAVEQLEKNFNIIRIFAGVSNTNRL
jgi:hypothetical protein